MQRQVALAVLALLASACGAGSSTPAPAPAPSLDVACSGTNCGAASPTQYSGSGVGVWRYVNASTSAVNVDVGIGGVRAGQSAVLVFSNGGAGPSSVLPSGGVAASNLLASTWLTRPVEADPESRARDEADAIILAKNREIALKAWDLSEGLASRGSLASGAAAEVPASTPALGTSRVWYDSAASTMFPPEYTATVRRVCALPAAPGATLPRNAVFWVDTSVSANDVSEADLDYYRDTFCGTAGGYASVTELRGDVWGSVVAALPDKFIQDPSGANLDVNIVFLGVPRGTYWAGYFHSFNNIKKSYSDAYAFSNESLAFFINAPGSKGRQGFYASTLLHELTHMVNFYQRSIKVADPYDTWLEEMSAMMTEDIVTPAVTPDHVAKIPDARIRPYVESGGAASLVAWKGLDDPQYPLGGSLGAFLNRRYGLAVYSSMVACSSKLTSYECVDSIIKERGGVGFADEFARLGASIFARIPAPGMPATYGFPQATAGKYTLGPVDLSAYYMALPEALDVNFPATSHTYDLDQVGAGKTTYTRNQVVVPPGTTFLLVIQ